MDRNILKANKKEDFIKIQEQIEHFFSGSAAEAITDDKTIVGIINTAVMPKKLDKEYYQEPNWEELYKKQTAGLYGQQQKEDGIIQETERKPSTEKPPTEIISKSKNKSSYAVRRKKQKIINVVGKKTDQKKKRHINKKRLNIYILILFVIMEIITVFVCRQIFLGSKGSEKPDYMQGSTEEPKEEDDQNEVKEPLNQREQDGTEEPVNQEDQDETEEPLNQKDQDGTEQPVNQEDRNQEQEIWENLNETKGQII